MARTIGPCKLAIYLLQKRSGRECICDLKNAIVLWALMFIVPWASLFVQCTGSALLMEVVDVFLSVRKGDGIREGRLLCCTRKR